MNDIDYVNMVKQSIDYVVNENTDADPNIILWETIKCVVRGDTIIDILDYTGGVSEWSICTLSLDHHFDDLNFTLQY